MGCALFTRLLYASVCRIIWLTNTVETITTESPDLSDMTAPPIARMKRASLCERPWIVKVNHACAAVAGVRQEFGRLLAGLAILVAFQGARSRHALARLVRIRSGTAVESGSNCPARPACAEHSRSRTPAHCVRDRPTSRSRKHCRMWDSSQRQRYDRWRNPAMQGDGLNVSQIACDGTVLSRGTKTCP